MNFFDKLGKTISSTSQTAVQKTKDMTEIVKMNTEISEINQNLTKTYEKIGRVYVEKCRGNSDEDLVPLLNTVTEYENQIKNLEKQIQTLRNTKKCPNCGSEIPKDVLFCPSCGTKVQSTPPMSQNTSEKRCPNCNSPIPASGDVRFCMVCGYPIESNTGNMANISQTSPNSFSSFRSDMTEKTTDILNGNSEDGSLSTMDYQQEQRDEKISDAYMHEINAEQMQTTDNENDFVNRYSEMQDEDKEYIQPNDPAAAKILEEKKEIDVVEPTKEQFLFCPECGHPIEEGNLFCIHCGTKIK